MPAQSCARNAACRGRRVDGRRRAHYPLRPQDLACYTCGLAGWGTASERLRLAEPEPTGAAPTSVAPGSEVTAAEVRLAVPAVDGNVQTSQGQQQQDCQEAREPPRARGGDVSVGYPRQVGALAQLLLRLTRESRAELRIETLEDRVARSILRREAVVHQVLAVVPSSVEVATLARCRLVTQLRAKVTHPRWASQDIAKIAEACRGGC
mmetsp:Transcript_50705/g.113945  ORF Transcript_50705/g.113945 Transcript_50705/m.113945 type:complete len:208 (-) Transcript_50705:371-994(-)|eukprot:CAMPEP_0181178214 /NCGR_PEP_ID=MMETSP1096-20121128/5603_1 /TAXON_ID=156174 ORGANISM="Chrysochromulina ericina, Strain CCMP281" /NCGR_SAMPLE_ID=MMETSP1096 /ASSEMBLY_ACC=CAM_ASM_000453 /LENGTH=207 /DNA_ID=CAMNT_0023266473 /DNA_START=259 /DNA_END=882 /DNA_ORIENTATION=-